MIIFGHPAIGKTSLLEKHPDLFTDWDVEYNKQRDRWILDHLNGMTFKEARYEYLVYPEKHPDYIEFLTFKWNEVKQRSKLLLASSHTLLKLFPQDFNLILNLEKDDFVNRNMQRGGEKEESISWKESIDKTISNTNIPTYTLNVGEYIKDIITQFL